MVSDTGAVWRGGDAWIACLWATAAHRGLANRLAQPRWRSHARAMALQVARRMQGAPQPATCRTSPPSAAAATGSWDGGWVA